MTIIWTEKREGLRRTEIKHIIVQLFKHKNTWQLSIYNKWVGWFTSSVEYPSIKEAEQAVYDILSALVVDFKEVINEN
jgi:hypothetical protein